MDFKTAQSILTPYGLNVTASEYEANSEQMVVVGMSGGVDSSASALILKLQGYQTVGMFMKNWDDEIDSECTAQADYQDAARVCEQIGIPYYAINFVQEYKEKVFSNFVSEYKAGFTPNPDILCNREIKFKVFFQKAMELGANFLATGHYCQTKDGKLIKGIDGNKDQSYFLYTIQSEVLNKVLFPIGSLQKAQVRQLAKSCGLVTHQKKDSTGICFIGERNFKNFLGNYIQSTQGNFVRLDDRQVVGNHQGYCFYTIGQRKGLGLGGPGGPWFVCGKDVSTNEVYVVEGENHPALYSSELVASNESWVNELPTLPLRCKAKIRYRQPDQWCWVSRQSNKLKVVFDEPQRAIAPRQSVVFYQDDNCLGGAIIETAGESLYQAAINSGATTTSLDH